MGGRSGELRQWFWTLRELWSRFDEETMALGGSFGDGRVKGWSGGWRVTSGGPSVLLELWCAVGRQGTMGQLVKGTTVGDHGAVVGFRNSGF
ncbi:hypothetical protein V6N11_044042 [Hibiscus sabdariffa]|uniref:Uncharacterized protein n=1 Tax=Hibiscus sabdariffa TaxID=183260 RepID=A0ABR2RE02_9ROSI